MPRKADANQSAIVEALRRVGATVQILSQVGHGCPDLLVGFRGRNYLIEVKNQDGRGAQFTPDEKNWHHEWSGTVGVVLNIEQALEYIGAAEYKPSETKGKP